MTVGLLDEVAQLLAADPSIDPGTAELVLAALTGEAQLAASLRGKSPSPATAADEAVEPVGAYLESLIVEGFRGIGQRTALALSPGPGLTLVVGRNGSGKSSFAEALEVLLTGTNQRWASRAAAWKEGWRNLHHDDPCVIEARMSVEGHPGGAIARRAWMADADLDDSSATAQLHGRRIAPLASLGWERDLAAFRPFLSYNELGSMLEEGPSALFDALASILGLDELVECERRLRETRLEAERARKAADASKKAALIILGETGDERAAACMAALREKPADLNAIEAILGGQVPTPEGDAGRLVVLERLLTLAAPDAATVHDQVGLLRRAQVGLDQLGGTDAAHAYALAELLEKALALHTEHQDADCPVCGTPGVLDMSWRTHTEQEVTRLRGQAEAAGQVIAIADEAHRRGLALISPVPPVFDQAEAVGLDAQAVVDAWRTWDAAPLEGLAALADHLEQHAESVDEAVAGLRTVAARLKAEQDDAWKPAAEAMAGWAVTKRAARDAAGALPMLKSAEQWVKATTAQLRADRFAPIREQAQDHWRTLSRGGSVALDDIRLEGSATRRRVQLDVSVDGVAGVALGVMSQGELHSLALSLFLPRAMLSESPFRFLAIDDPVQAMDPARVDGLALVLQSVAQYRQVIVFTHDDRLPEAIRRLRVDATIVEVTRRPNSVVELRPALDPVERSLSDARSVAKSERLPEAVARRVIPGLCRQALEAACIEAVRRRRLAKGAAHDQVEIALEDADRLTDKMALALFDDAGRGGDVLPRLNAKYGHGAGDTFVWANKGAHGNAPLDARDLVRQTEQLAAKIRTQ